MPPRGRRGYAADAVIGLNRRVSEDRHRGRTRREGDPPPANRDFFGNSWFVPDGTVPDHAAQPVVVLIDCGLIFDTERPRLAARLAVALFQVGEQRALWQLCGS